MAKSISDYVVKRKDGLKVCKKCQQIIEDEEDHMRRRHPELLKYMEKKEEKEDLWMCCHCGLYVKNWQEHIREQHPEIIEQASKRVKQEPEEEEFEFDF
jgi:hypothetical protein